MTVRPGQIWRERDNRINRTVLVLHAPVFMRGHVRAIVRCIESDRQSTPRLDRFNGKSKCYEYVSEVQP